MLLPIVNDCTWSDEGAHACDGGDSGHVAKDIVARLGGRVPSRDAYGDTSPWTGRATWTS